ncbi:hypothetical protein, partial [Bacillus cereus group sp. BfR-BA-01511]|uniref:hypothetical protein n=1 Tax=Bacillus cereus group sp. BfR-BA-01511 TaxID=2920365 RepID=UPI001F5A3F4B
IYFVNDILYTLLYTLANVSNRIHVFIKKTNPEYFQDVRVKKGTGYIQIDMKVLMNFLQKFLEAEGFFNE